MGEKTYLAIDLKSFYASVECVERGLDPLTTNLVVADASRTEKTICLAVTPALKAYGIPGRARLFEVIQKVREINARRKMNAPGHRLEGSSCQTEALERMPELALDFIAAPPRMAHYIACSARIYEIYLKYAAPEDIHVYSIDEVFMDVTNYLPVYQLTARELAMKIILDVLRETGITATAGIGTNLYLCKIAMDIRAKHIPADRNGVRIAELDEESYRQTMWEHQPLTDFWRVGRGTAKKLENIGIRTMGDIARCSLQCEDLLYRMFGVNAELLIDHAWGFEPCTIADIKAYHPTDHSLGSGQVLQEPYPCDQARLVTREMTDLLALELTAHGLATNQIVLTVGYDRLNLAAAEQRARYRGMVKKDAYGRMVPKSAHGTVSLDQYTDSARQLVAEAAALFDRIVDPQLLVRRITLTFGRVLPKEQAEREESFRQLDLFAAPQRPSTRSRREEEMQQVILKIKEKYGKNAILKGMNLEEGATAQQRNAQIGGHKA